MNETLVLGLLGVVAAAFILRPLWRGRGTAAAPTRTTVPGAVQPAMPDELAELELDRAMGRVSEADYQRWRAELDTGAGGEEVAPAPAPVDATTRAEALVRRWRDADRPTCPTCGVRPEPGARYCSNCGASLEG